MISRPYFAANRNATTRRCPPKVCRRTYCDSFYAHLELGPLRFGPDLIAVRLRHHSQHSPRRCARRSLRAHGIPTSHLAPNRGDTPILVKKGGHGNRHTESRGCGCRRGNGRGVTRTKDAVGSIRDRSDIIVRCVFTCSVYCRTQPSTLAFVLSSCTGFTAIVESAE
jgi:hypothetical protein